MIPIRAYTGQRVGVLGLGRSGLVAARALKAGGAEPVCWDDDDAARETAAGEGFEIGDLSREREAASMARLIVSPGIPHLYPRPHRAVARPERPSPRTPTRRPAYEWIRIISASTSLGRSAPGSPR